MKLVIFDCDGTIVDSQNAICAAMDFAYDRMSLAPPSRTSILRIIGLSLPEAFAVLAADQSKATRVALAEHYKAAFPEARLAATQHDVLFPGAEETINELAARQDVLLGIATGKSRRGVHRLLDQQGWRKRFFTIQTADDNPSKPNPTMIERAMAEVGVDRRDTLMIGDTTFDIQMALAARVAALGVSWGYHEEEHLRLAGAHAIADTYDDVPRLVDTVFGSIGMIR